MKKLFAVFFVTCMITGSAFAADKPDPVTQAQASQLLHDSKPVYSCRMKPDWFSDKPGQCPCCTMDLEQVKAIKNGQAVFGDPKAMTEQK